jgi:hypothetical protein
MARNITSRDRIHLTNIQNNMFRTYSGLKAARMRVLTTTSKYAWRFYNEVRNLFY